MPPRPSINLRVVLPSYALLLATFHFSASRFAYVGFMVREFYPHLSESEVGYYTGMLTGAFYIGQTLNGPPLGHAADAIGVFTPMLVGAVAGVVFPILYGTASSFEMAWLWSFLYGLTNGAMPLVKVFLYECLPPEACTYAMSALTGLWGMASVLSPMLGGYLSYPVQKYSFMSDSDVLKRHPFLLPNLAGAVVSFIAGVGLVVQHVIDEKNKKKNNKKEESHDPNKAAPMNFFQYLRTNTTQVVLVLGTYSILGGLHVISSEVFPLLLMLPVSHDGFGLETNGIGTMGMFQGIFVFTASFFVPTLNSKYGYKRSLMISTAMTVPILLLGPLTARIPQRTVGLVCITLIQGMSRNILGQVGFNAIMVMINYCCEKQYLARVNAYGNTAVSATRFVFPAVASTIFAWSASSSVVPFPFNTMMVYFFYSAVAAMAIMTAYFLKPERDHPHDHQQFHYHDGQKDDENTNILEMEIEPIMENE
eukprot:PhF_6_TR9734/c0_g1_i1/m.14991